MLSKLKTEISEVPREVKNFDVNNFTWFFKNRVTLVWVGISWVALRFYTEYQDAFLKMDELKTSMSDAEINELLSFYLQWTLTTGVLWYILLSWTLLWYGTWKVYNIVKKQLEEDPNYDFERFFRKKLGKSFLRLFWYCQLQWMYLAMKEHWREEDFLKLKEKYSDVIIPNF